MARILIVDDEASILNYYETVLSALGHDVHKASNGEEAWALLVKSEFDLVITDWQMPKMTGIVLVRMVKLQMPSLPVIMITSNSVGEVERKVIDFVLAKPMPLALFTETVKKALKK